MIGVAMYTTIETLWKKHKNKALIARLTGHDWKTVAKRVKEIEQGKEYQPKKLHPRILDPYYEQIIERLEENLSEIRIHEKIQQKGAKVGYSTVKNYLALIKKQDKIFLRIHTLPAEEVQADFGSSVVFSNTLRLIT